MSYPYPPDHGRDQGWESRQRPAGQAFGGQGASGFPGRATPPPGPSPAPPQYPRAQPQHHYPQHQPEPPSPSRGGAPRGRSVRIDPVIVETVVGVLWLAVGTIGLGAAGAGTLLLAVALAGAGWVLVENRRRGPGPFDPARSTELMRLGGGAVAATIVASIVLGLVGYSSFLPGVAAGLTGAAFLLLARSTGQRPTHFLGIAVLVLGAISLVASTQETTVESGGFVAQGVVGLVIGVLVLASAADRVGMLAVLRDRMR